MALHDPSPKLTYEDYLLFPDDGRRHELLDGEHYVTASPFPPHQRLVVRFTSRMDTFLEDNPIGEVFCSPCEVILSEHDVVQPDLLFISKEKEKIVSDKKIQGTPDLIIEVLSEGTRRRDEGLKKERYERHGVLEYWIVDPWMRAVKVYRLQGRRFRLTATLYAQNQDILTTPLLPGLDFPLAKIFR
jgi:Uma2 family endonuclease